MKVSVCLGIVFLYAGSCLATIELRRKYMDYLTIFDKKEIGNSFDLFVERLQLVESFNKDETRCRWYLTQWSDSEEVNQENYTKRCIKSE